MADRDTSEGEEPWGCDLCKGEVGLIPALLSSMRAMAASISPSVKWGQRFPISQGRARWQVNVLSVGWWSQHGSPGDQDCEQEAGSKGTAVVPTIRTILLQEPERV